MDMLLTGCRRVSMNLVYGAYGTPAAAVADASILPLDKISCAGALSFAPLSRALEPGEECVPIIEFCRPALKFCKDPAFVSHLFTTQDIVSDKRPTSRRGTSTDAKWTDHLEDLKEAGILESAEEREVLGLATYFAVPKNEEKARAIFNGKRISMKMCAPPPLNLPAIAEIIEAAAQVEGPASILCADWRHWFHQMRLDKEISHRFCIRTEEGGPDGKRRRRFWRWATLPMGLSWSPFVAQCVSWSIILSSIPEKKWPFVSPRDVALVQPPARLHFKQGKGFMAIYLDNLIAFGAPDDIEVINQCRGKLERSWNLTIKEWTVTHPKSWASSTVSFLGVEVKRHVHGDTYRMCWRQDSEKLKKWASTVNEWLDADQTSFRTVTRICGRLMWHHHISLRPLAEAAEVIRVLKRVAIERQKQPWDTQFPWNPAHREILKKAWEVCEKNTYFTSEAVDANKEALFCCSDASTDGWGYIVFDKDGSCQTVKGDLWRKEKRWHIFLKEFEAAEMCIRHVTEIHENVDIVIGIDNTAVAQAFRNRYSSSEFVCERLIEIFHLLEAKKCTLHVITVRGIDNAADIPSRPDRDPADLAVEAPLTFALLKAGRSGIRPNEYEPQDARDFMQARRDRLDELFDEDLNGLSDSEVIDPEHEAQMDLLAN